jgi:transposase
MVTEPKTIEAIYRLSHEQKLSEREIARQLQIGCKTVNKYLDHPLGQAVRRKPRHSKLDPFKALIRESLEQCPRVSCVVLGRKLQEHGFTGGRTILQEYVATVRQVVGPGGSLNQRAILDQQVRPPFQKCSEPV